MRAPRGQHFLYQPAWQRRVSEAVAPSINDTLIEIGGGLGDVTALLAESGARLLVVEVEPALATGLRSRFSSQPRVSVIEADILQLDLGRICAESRAGALRIFGNLPYYITSPILLRLFAYSRLIRDAIVMVQQEVADRLVAEPGNREYGLLTATVRLYCRPSKIFDLPPGAFQPAPRVHSTLLRLEFAPQAAQLGVDERAFLAFLRLAFGQKRKLLANNLRARYAPSAIAHALKSVHPRGAEARSDWRAEQLDLPDLARIFSVLAANAGG